MKIMIIFILFFISSLYFSYFYSFLFIFYLFFLLRFRGFDDEWNSQKFKENLDIKAGKGFKASEYVDKGIPLIKIDNVSYGKITWKTRDYLPNEYFKTYSDLILRKNDIVLALNRPITNNKLKIAKLTDKDELSILYQRVGKIFINGNYLDREFIFYLLNKEIFEFVQKNSVGSDQPFISTNKLKDLELKIPSIKEQQKIGIFLNLINNKIELLENKHQTYLDFKKYLMQQIFTQKLRFNKFNDGWREVKLKSFSDMKYGKMPNKTKITDDKTKYPIFTGFRILGYYNESNIKKDDILVTARGSGAGYAKLAPDDAYLTNLSIALNINQKIALTHYLYYYFQIYSLRYLDSGSAQPQITINDLNIVKVKLPSIKEQKEISKCLLSLDNKIYHIAIQIENMKLFKKGLLQQMFV